MLSGLRRETRAPLRSHTMSILAVLLLVILTSGLGLILAMALARAVLYANVLTELDHSARWLAPSECPRVADRLHGRASRAGCDRPARRCVGRHRNVSV